MPMPMRLASGEKTGAFPEQSNGKLYRLGRVVAPDFA
jgi:hypothetical protein